MTLCAAAEARTKPPDVSLDAPPAGIVASSASLAKILERNAAALGRLEPGKANTRRETWSRDEAGYLGTETLVRVGLDYRSRIEHGTLVEEYGQLDDGRWHRDFNGTLSPLAHEEEDDSFVMLRVLGAAAEPKNDVTLAGEVSDPKPAYVLKVTIPHRKHPEWIFYDRDSALVDRTEYVVDNERVFSLYDDYRTTRGLTEPWHVHDSLTKSGLEYDYRRTALVLGERVEPGELARPAGAFRPAAIAGAQSLPTHFAYGGLPVVRLTVNGRGLDFELSLGSPRSIIDRDVARELNLPTFGQTIQSKSGDALGYDTVISNATIGQVALHDFALRAVSFFYHPDEQTKVVGSLGFDFLHSGVFKIDYVNGRVFVYDSASAAIPGTADRPIAVPLNFDDGVPFTSGEISGHPTDDILLDNTWPFSIVMGGFANRFPDAVPDTEGRKHGHTVVPFADANAYGREADVWLATVPRFVVGGMPFQNLTMLGVDVDFPGERNIDAIIGASILQYFDVWIDYAHARVVLAPNADFHRQFRRSGS